MTQQERSGQRRLDYSAWHRRDSISRFLHGQTVWASRLAMIDIDGMYVEAKHWGDRAPVALIEAAAVSYVPIDEWAKSARILTQLGRRANIPVFTVLYRLDSLPNPADPRWCDIAEFYVRETYPANQTGWSIMTPNEYAEFLVWLRSEHISVKNNPYQMRLRQYNQIDFGEIEQRWRFREIF